MYILYICMVLFVRYDIVFICNYLILLFLYSLLVTKPVHNGLHCMCRWCLSLASHTSLQMDLSMWPADRITRSPKAASDIPKRDMGHYGSLWVTALPDLKLCESKWINVTRQGTIIDYTSAKTPPWSNNSTLLSLLDTWWATCISLFQTCLHCTWQPHPTASNWTIGCGPLFPYPLNCWQTFHRCLSALVCYALICFPWEVPHTRKPGNLSILWHFVSR